MVKSILFKQQKIKSEEKKALKFLKHIKLKYLWKILIRNIY